MNTRINILVAILVFLTSFSSCKKEENTPTKDKTAQIHFLKSALGGCNSKTEENIVRSEGKNDTVIIRFLNDTLNIFAGLNYICCAPFITDCNVNNDSIFITITDTCPTPNECYCRCNCYYTFDYYFDSVTDNNYYFQIILNDPGEENQILFSDGEINIQKLKEY